MRRREGGSISTTVNPFPAGQYVLRLVATGPQGSVSASRSFDVAWALVTWERSRRDLDVEAELALSEEQFAAYRTLPVGEKEAYLENFWRTLDPTPETADNEVLSEFHPIGHARRVFREQLVARDDAVGQLPDILVQRLGLHEVPGNHPEAGVHLGVQALVDLVDLLPESLVDFVELLPSRGAQLSGVSPWIHTH